MKKALVLAAAFLVFISLSAYADSEDYYSYSYARISYVTGDVYVQRTSDLGYEKGEVNLPVVQGDKLGTRDGQAEVHLGRKNYLRLDQYSQVEFAGLPQRDGDRVKIHLIEGNVYLRVNYQIEEKNIEIHTPDASYYVLDQGLYRIDVRSDGETELFVYEGSIEAAGEEGSVMVQAKERLVAADGNFQGSPEYFSSGFDGFDRWNESRDALLVSRSRTSYLPSDLSDYEDELADNGRWVYEQPYGNVWVPYGDYDDWRPYYYGRWVWYPVIGWTWVSSESWGWSVYHYGRWHWRLGLGWYWIPTTRWGPAWVHWHWGYGYDHVGWCPLSYYNRPVVILGNRFYDRYYDPYYPIRSRALTVVHRDQLQAPRIYRHALRDNQLDTLGRISLRAEQPSIRPVVDRSSPTALSAHKIFSRSESRGSARNYGSGSAVTSTRLRSGGRPDSAGTAGRAAGASSLSRKGSVSSESLRNSGSGSSFRTYSRSLSGNSAEKTVSSGKGAAGSVRSIRPDSSYKTYPSRRESSAEMKSGSLNSSESRIRSYAPKYGSSSSSRSERSTSSLGVIRKSSPSDPGSDGVKTYAPRLRRNDGQTSSRDSVSRSNSGSTKAYGSNSVSGYSPRSNVSSSSVRSIRSYSSSSLRSGAVSSRSSVTGSNYGSRVSSTRSFSAPSYSTRSYSSPKISSRSYGSPSISSRSYSSPKVSSRSYSSSPSYSKSYSGSSRSYSAPSRSSSPSFSSPRSYSAPSGGGSHSSRGSSSSGSSGHVRKKG